MGIIAPALVDGFAENSDGIKPETIAESLTEDTLKRYDAREQEFGSELMREIERVVLLRSVDENWMTHIDAIDQLKYGVGLQAYGQRDPVVEYKFQAFNMFEDMNKTIQDQAVRMIFTIKVQKGAAVERKAVAGPGRERLGGEESGEKKKTKSITRQGSKIGRNDPCPCGSGKKYKNCCGS